MTTEGLPENTKDCRMNPRVPLWVYLALTEEAKRDGIDREQIIYEALAARYPEARARATRAARKPAARGG